MGNIKFKLTNMLPSAWFFKLKDMNKTSKTHHKHYLPPQAPPSSPPTTTVKTPARPEPQIPSRKSYHIARELTIESPPRKSKSSPRSRKSSRRSSSISTCSCQSSSTLLSYQSRSITEEADVVVENSSNNVGFLVEDALLKPGGNDKQIILDNAALTNNNNNNKSSEQQVNVDIDIDVDKKSLLQNNNTNIIINNFQLLPPIITNKGSSKPQDEKIKPPSRRLTVVSPGRVKLKINSPRIMGRKQGQNGNKSVGKKSSITSSKKRRSISESFAVVKSSFNPPRDFRESMVEMILQNNLTAAKDLEDLLACYLSLNSDEYHDVIIKVFKQIWIDLRQGI